MDMHASPSGLSSASPGGHRDDLGPHPSAETLAALLDGRLPRDQRAAVDAHIADCDDCLEILGETAAFLGDEAQAAAEPRTGRESDVGVTVSAAITEWPRGRGSRRLARRWTLVGGASLAAAALLVMAVRERGVSGVAGSPEGRVSTGPVREVASGSATLRQWNEPPGAADLFHVLRWRPSTARLAAMPYRPPRLVAGSAARFSEPLAEVRAAAARLREQAARATAADAQWARGLAELAVGDLDGAIRSLEAGAALRSDTAIEIDLSAAYLARAERTGDTEPARRGLERVDRALSRTPFSLPALFNRALALEYLGRSADAQRARDTYLALDRSSAWAAEIRNRQSR